MYQGILRYYAIFREIGFHKVESKEKLLRVLRLRVVLLIMEGSDIAVPRIIAEILKLAFAVHWLDESGKRYLFRSIYHADLNISSRISAWHFVFADIVYIDYLFLKPGRAERTLVR